MYPARLLKGYPKDGPESERPTCALHGPRGRFRHIASDRKDEPMAVGGTETSSRDLVSAVLWRSGLGKLTRAECEVMAEQIVSALALAEGKP
jgi:hypothetical protein